MILVLFILFSAFAAFCGLLIYGYRSRAHSAEARANRAEGALGETKDENSFLRGLTEKAIRYAAEAAKMDADELLPTRVETREQARDVANRLLHRDYTPQTVAFCPTCNVSVRHPPESFPVTCPREGCGTLIDPVLDNPPEL